MAKQAKEINGVPISISGSYVESVTGTLVDNTDPLNPIIDSQIDDASLTSSTTTLSAEKITSKGYTNYFVDGVITTANQLTTVQTIQGVTKSYALFLGEINGVDNPTLYGLYGWDGSAWVAQSYPAVPYLSKEDFLFRRIFTTTFGDNAGNGYIFNEQLADYSWSQIGSDGVTNLGYTASPTNGIVTSDTGTDATIPLATGTDAGLLSPTQKTLLDNTSGTNSGDNATNTTSNSYADGKVADAINDGTTTIAPSQNAVFDALALKAPLASPTFTGTVTTPAIIVSSETASRVAIIDGSKNVKSADTSTYPSLTELSYGKGVTSPIQPQIDSSVILGELLNIETGEFTSYTTSGANISQSIVSNNLRITNGTGNTTWNQYLEIGYTTWLPKYSFKIKISNITNGNGLGIGWKHTSGSGRGVRIDLSGGGTRGTFYNCSFNTSSVETIEDTGSQITFTNSTDDIYIGYERNIYEVVWYIQKNDEARKIILYEADLTTSNNALSAVCNLVIFSFGGTQDIELINVESSQEKHPELCFVSDSIGYGFYCGDSDYQTEANRISDSLIGDFCMYVASGAKITDFSTNMSEFLLLKPKKCYLRLGSNDATAAVSAVDYLAALNVIKETLKDNDIELIISTVLPTTNVTRNSYITQYNTEILALDEENTIVNGYATFQSAGLLKSEYDSGDGVHTNTSGQKQQFELYYSAAGKTLKKGLNPYKNSYASKSAGNTIEPCYYAYNTNNTIADDATTYNRAYFISRIGSPTIITTSFGSSYSSSGLGEGGFAGTLTEHAFGFFTNSLKRGSIDETGIWQIGTSTSNISTLNGKFYIIENTSYINAAIVSTGASATTGGGLFTLGSDDGAELAINERLGGIFFGGSRSSAAFNNSGLIAIYAEETWTDTSCPAYLIVQLAASGATTRSEVLRVSSKGNFLLGGTANPQNGTKSLSIFNGTAVSGTLAANAFVLASKDIVAGNAAPHFYTENGDEIKIYSISGWGTPTGSLTRTTFDTTTVTLTQLAERVAALISDLKTGHKLLKA